MLESGQTIRFDLRKLKFERLSRNITGAKMGEILGISSNAYYKKERGESSITLREFSLLLTAMRIHPRETEAFFAIDSDTDRNEGMDT